SRSTLQWYNVDMVARRSGFRANFGERSKQPDRHRSYSTAMIAKIIKSFWCSHKTLLKRFEIAEIFLRSMTKYSPATRMLPVSRYACAGLATRKILESELALSEPPCL